MIKRPSKERMVINGIEINIETFSELLKDIKYCIRQIDEGHSERALYTLRVLEGHLEKNLFLDKLQAEYQENMLDRLDFIKREIERGNRYERD